LNHILVTYYYTVKAFCLQGFIYSKVISSIWYSYYDIYLWISLLFN